MASWKENKRVGIVAGGVLLIAVIFLATMAAQRIKLSKTPQISEAEKQEQLKNVKRFIPPPPPGQQ